ncbi:MAG: BtpA/SgcQ family protein [Planctomycetota bacterium]
MQLLDLFPHWHRRRLLIGVVHLPALPGSPGYGGSMEPLLKSALADARALMEGGADGIIVENFGDRPFFAESVPAETIAALTRATQIVCDAVGELPVGVNVLRNDARSALGIVAATDAQFLRVNVHVGAMVTDQGLIQGHAAQTLRARDLLCPGAPILADVHVKHAVPLGSESLEQAAEDTFHRGLADALVISGAGTGKAPDLSRIARVRAALPEAPLMLGSGLAVEQAESLCAGIDAAIVASSLKIDGVLRNPVDPERVERLRRVFEDMGPPPLARRGHGAG